MDGAVERLLAAGLGLQQQGEFVAAHARHGVVVVDAGQQALGHVLEHAIARRMAKGVIDRLETVEVEEHQHHPGLLPLGLLQGGVQAVLEQRAVGQVGEGIVVGQAVDALLAGLAFADVGEEAHIAGQVAFIVEHCGDAYPRRVVLAVAPFQPDLAFPAAALAQLLEHVALLGVLLLLDGKHAGELVEHLGHGIAADAGECFVGLDDVAGRVGNEDRRGGVLEHGRCHAQVFFGPALLADVAAHAEHPLEALVFVPHQHQAQLDGDLAAVGAQAVEQEQLRGQGAAQLGQLGAVVQHLADALEQVVDTAELGRVGNDRLPAVGKDPVGLVAQHRLHRGADIVELQLAVGGEDHVADALGEHAVALFAVAQRFAGFDLHGDILAHAYDTCDQAFAVAGQHLLADVVAPPATVAMAEAQLAVQRLAIAGVALLLAQGAVVLGIAGMQEHLPEAVTHLCQLRAVVTEGLAEVAVAEDHPLAVNVLHVELVGHGTHHVRPEALAFEQRQLHLLAAGDVADAQDYRLVVTALLRQSGHQPQVQFTTERGG